ncbi:MAG: 50S ribosomal protein L18 [Pirellulaceae bacterium]|nr:50S ribosomal protein L18 [Pirellulaceae bacterium]
MDKRKYIEAKRLRRRRHVRRKLSASRTVKPRLSIDRSLKHVSCQIIDDATGQTVAAASTKDKALASSIKYGGNKDAATLIGKTLAEKALEAGIKEVSFDRGHCKYHGRIAAVADAAREAGLSF